MPNRKLNELLSIRAKRNQGVCSVKELNKYRHLTSLKSDFERNYMKEQKMIKIHVQQLCDPSRSRTHPDNLEFQEWLLWGNKQTPSEEILKRRYMNMVSKELDSMNNFSQKPSTHRIHKEEKRYLDHISRKLNDRKQTKEAWKRKEFSVLAKIGQEVEREARIEEYRRKIKEETDLKKQAMLERRIAYHLQKLQKNDLTQEDSEGRILEKSGYKKGTIHLSEKSLKTVDKKSSPAISHDTHSSSAEQKKDLFHSRARRFSSNEGTIHLSEKSLKTVDKKSSPAISHDTHSSSAEQKKDLFHSRARRFSSNEGTIHLSEKSLKTVDKKSSPAISHDTHSSSAEQKKDLFHSRARRFSSNEGTIHLSEKSLKTVDKKSSPAISHDTHSSSAEQKKDLFHSRARRFSSNEGTIHLSEKSLKTVDKKSSPAISHDTHSSSAEQKKDLFHSRARRFSSNEGYKNTNISRRTSQDIHKTKANIFHSRARRFSSDEGNKDTYMSLKPSITIRSPEAVEIYEDEENAKSSDSAEGTLKPHDSYMEEWQQHYEYPCQEKVTSEELNSIIRDVMTWVVAAVVTTLYPVVTDYEAKLRHSFYPPSEASFSSDITDTTSCYSTCSEVFLRQRSHRFQENPVSPLELTSIYNRRTPVERTYPKKVEIKLPEPKYNNISGFPHLKPCKSDSYLFTAIKTDTKKSRDVSTETDGLGYSLPPVRKFESRSMVQELKNACGSFKYNLKEENTLILEDSYEETQSEFPQTIHSVSFEAEISPQQEDTDEELSPNINIPAAASAVVDTVLDTFHSAAEAKCTKGTSRKNVSVHFEPHLTANGIKPTSPKESTPETSPCNTPENMPNVAEDMIRIILEQLITLMSSKLKQLVHHKITTRPSYPQPAKDSTSVFIPRENKWKASSADHEAANSAFKEGIQKLVLRSFSQSSLMGYIEEVISVVLGYIQIELNNERLFATEETIIVLTLLDAILTQLHRLEKADHKKRHPRLTTPSYNEERNRIASAEVATGSRRRCRFPSINVPGMFFYSEDENEDVENIVGSVLNSSVQDETTELQEQTRSHWSTKKDADLPCRTSINLFPTTFESKTELRKKKFKTNRPAFDNIDLFKDQELEPHEIDRVARKVTSAVITHLKNFKTRDDSCPQVDSEASRTEYCDTASKLIDSLLSEFSDTQIKLVNRDHGSSFSPNADKTASIRKVPLQEKEPPMDKIPSKIKATGMDEVPPIHKMTTATPSHEEPSMTKIPSVSELLVNKIFHRSVYEIFQEYTPQDSTCKDIDGNDENLSELANSMIEEIFQHQLNLLLNDDVPKSVCLPQKSEAVRTDFCKIAQKTSRGCQTLSPYTIKLSYDFLENLVYHLLLRIFSTFINTKTKVPEVYSEIDFLQMKLVSTIVTEMNKNEDIIIQNVKSLHTNYNKVTQLVSQTIYNNLLPQFGSQETIQNCVVNGCKILSETIVNLIVQEVCGNQLQNYFSSEFIPEPCRETVTVVDDTIQTTKSPLSKSSFCKLPLDIIEEIAVNFLSKLLSVFPKATNIEDNSLCAAIKNIILKILNSFQKYISKSQISIVSPSKKSATRSLADNETIEKVATSTYYHVLKHSGSHGSMYKDLMSQNTILSDIIGFLMVKEISASEFHHQIEEETSGTSLVLETIKIMEKVVDIISHKWKKTLSSPKKIILYAKVLEETLALFLAKLVSLQNASSKCVKNLSEHELSNIASQLTKSVTSEIVRNNISIVATTTKENVLNQKSVEIISQIVNSVYNHVLQQSRTHEGLYYDVNSKNCLFPEEVASLIINGILNCPLETISPKYPSTTICSDLNIKQIVEKAHQHVIKMEPKLETKLLDQNLSEENSQAKIIPHCEKQPIKIDPVIIEDHLGVISIKTQPLQKLQDQCLTDTGYSIEALRGEASVCRRKSSTLGTSSRKARKEKRVYLDQKGRLNIKPLELASRNSFPNLLKPDITKVELLKDVQNKTDLIIRLITHDINQDTSEIPVKEAFISDEKEIVLKEILKEEPKYMCFDEDMEDMTPIESGAAEPLMSGRISQSLPENCYSPIPSVSTSNTEVSPFGWKDIQETYKRKRLSKLNVTASKSAINSTSFTEMRTNLTGKESKSSTSEPTHFLLHRIMTSSSYNEDDLPSFTSNDEDHSTGPSAKITEDSLYRIGLESTSSLKFYTLFQRESMGTSIPSSKGGTSGVMADDENAGTSKQRVGVIKKMSSALSKLFPKPNADIPKSSPPSPPNVDKK
ncbi:fibrous sheath-interacting protein 2-like [Erinaceus europaeus]|uniref:Fibrous sheath-interacting protein 2-like n=1 Tax=Erinaceus europaeus TaxID=9365 RepID=A0ABM3WPX7_ERIEU|nr:fibrous sheath-interacting protein 2-like [Erinaceus europaeus]